MSKITSILLLGLLALSFQGCFSQKDVPAPVIDQSKDQSKDQPEDQPDKPVEEHKTQNVSEESTKASEIDEIEDHTEAHTKASFFDETDGFKWELIEQLQTQNPDNLALKYLVAGKDKVNALSTDKQDRVYNIVKSGLLLTRSKVGAYAQEASDYDNYDWLLLKIMNEYHKSDGKQVHTENWGKANKDDPSLKIGDGEYSLRIRVARNFQGMPFPASCEVTDEKNDFLAIEETVSKVLRKMELPLDQFKTKFGEMTATMYTLTDGREGEAEVVETVDKKNTCCGCSTPKAEQRTTKYVYADNQNENQMNTLRSQGIFSEDPTKDAALSVGQINKAFPTGRATWVYTDGTSKFVIYINEEDALRIQMLTKGNDFNAIKQDLHKFLTLFEEALVKEDKRFAFAKKDKLGYLASCPSNNGTGMRASGKVGLPEFLKKSGYNTDDVKNLQEKNLQGSSELAELLTKGQHILHEISDSNAFRSRDLQLRGGRGEDTPPGPGGMVDLSYKKRTFVSEEQIIQKTAEAMRLIAELESGKITVEELNAPAKNPSLRKGKTQKKMCGCC